MEKLNAVIAQGVDVFFTFNSIGSALKNAEGENIFDTLGALFFTIYVDHPISQYNRFVEGPKNSILAFIDQTHLEWARHNMAPELYKALMFIPHGGMASPTAAKRKRPSKNFMFAGTYKSIEPFVWRKENLLQEVTRTIEDAHEMMTENPGLPMHKAVRTSLDSRHIVLSRENEINLFRICHKFLHPTRTVANRVSLLEGFRARGLTVDIYGGGNWADFCHNVPEYNYLGELSLVQSLDIISDYKFVLNDNNDFPAGSHERVFNTLLNGALPITFDNTYYRDNFQFGDLCMLYDRTSLDGLADDQQGFDAFYVEKIAMLRRMDAESQFHLTWQSRAATAINIILMCMIRP